jgi:hypothetical protein
MGFHPDWTTDDSVMSYNISIDGWDYEYSSHDIEALQYLWGKERDLPELVGDIALLSQGLEDTSYLIQLSDLLGGYVDPDGDILSVASLEPSVGSIEYNGDESWTLMPPGDFYGVVELDYQVTDGNSGSVNASQAITFDNQNDLPELTDGVAVLVDGVEDVAYTINSTDLLQGYTDVDGDSLSISGLEASTDVLTNNNDGTWTLTAPQDFNGQVDLSYSVSDGSGASTPVSVDFSIAPVNDDPVLSGDQVVLTNGIEGFAYMINSIDLLKGWSDVDGDSLFVSSLESSVGVLSINNNDSWILSAPQDFSGHVELNYVVVDESGASESASIQLILDPIHEDLNQDDITGFVDRPGLSLAFDGFKAKYLLGEGESAVPFQLSSNGRPLSDASTKWWNAVAAAATDDGFLVLLEGVQGNVDGKYNVFSTGTDGVVDTKAGWRTADLAFSAGWENLFELDLNQDDITGFVDRPGLSLAFDGFKAKYLLGEGESAVSFQLSSNGRPLSDAWSKWWNAVAAAATDDGFLVLLEGVQGNVDGKYNVFSTGTDGVVDTKAGWRTADLASSAGWENLFELDLNQDDITGFVDRPGLSLAFDGFKAKYLLGEGESAVSFQLSSNGRPLSDAWSKWWNAVAAAATDDGFLVLLEGVQGNVDGKYNVFSTGTDGVVDTKAGWRTADLASSAGWENLFELDLNQDDITGFVDRPGLSLAFDGFKAKYLLGEGETAVPFQLSSNGRPLSDAWSKWWNAVAAAATDDGFLVLLEGVQGNVDGKYNVFSTGTDGVVDTKAGWRTADLASSAGWENLFELDLNNDDITGFVDRPGLSLAFDGFKSYYLLENSDPELDPITFTNKSGRPISPTFSKQWDAVASTIRSNGNGYQVLLQGEEGSVRDGQFALMMTDVSGRQTGMTGFKDSAFASNNWFDRFGSGFNPADLVPTVESMV